MTDPDNGKDRDIKSLIDFLDKFLKYINNLLEILLPMIISGFLAFYIVKLIIKSKFNPETVYMIILIAIIYFGPTIKEFVRQLSLKVAKMKITILGVEMAMTVKELMTFIQQDNERKINKNQRDFLNQLKSKTGLIMIKKKEVPEPAKEVEEPTKDKFKNALKSDSYGLIAIDTDSPSDDNVVVRYEEHKPKEKLLRFSYMQELRALRNAGLIRTTPNNKSLRKCETIYMTNLGRKFVTEMNKQYIASN